VRQQSILVKNIVEDFNLYRCIGQHREREHSDSKPILVRCTNESETPSNPNHPEWGFLCAKCSGEAPHGPRETEERVNVGALQADSQEYKDSIEMGLMVGMREPWEG
jgi:hypothetical protein